MKIHFVIDSIENWKIESNENSALKSDFVM